MVGRAGSWAPAGRPALSPPPGGRENVDRSGKGNATKNRPLSHQERDRSAKGRDRSGWGDPLTTSVAPIITSVAFLVRSEEG